MADPQSLLVELKAHVDNGDVDAGLSTLSKIKVKQHPFSGIVARFIGASSTAPAELSLFSFSFTLLDCFIGCPG